MTSDNVREVFKAHREAQNKYTYFLLAAAAAAIAFAVNKTSAVALARSQAPLALAVLSWGLSFFAGTRHLAYVSSTLYANVDLLRVESGQHPEVGGDPQLIAAAGQGIRSAIEWNSERANRWAHWQFRLLVAGAVLYVAWHVLEMYLRGVSPPAPTPSS